MARPRAKLDRLGQAEEVFERLKTEAPGLSRERLLAVSHGLKGELSLIEIAQRVGRSRATIQSRFSLYREGGISQLCSRSEEKGGRKAAMNQRAWNEFRKNLAKGSFRTGQQAQEWIFRRFKIHRYVSTVRRWMGKLGARLKVVRPRHPNRSESKSYEFRNQLARLVFKDLKEHAPEFRERPIRLWVADEARFGLKPCHRRAWVRRGVRAHKDNRWRSDWQYVRGALQPELGLPE